MATPADNSNNTSTVSFQESIQFALQSAGVGIWDMQLQAPWTIVWDDLCKELYGLYSNNTIPYTEVIKYIHEEDRSFVTEAVEKALRPDGDGAYDVTYRTIGGDDHKLRWVRFIGKGYLDQNGVPYRFSGVAMDVTAEKLAQQKAEEAENRAASLEKGSSIGAFQIYFKENRISYAPPFSMILTGELLPNMSWQYFIDHVHPDDLGGREAAYFIASQTGDLYYEVRTVWNNGSTHWIRVVGNYRFDEHGTPEVFTGAVQDITEEKEKDEALKIAVQQLKENEQRLQAIISQAPIGIGLLIGKDMVIETANGNLLTLWGKDRSVYGKQLAQALPELEGQPFMALLEKVYNTGIPHYGYSTMARLEHQGQLKEMYFDFVYTPMKDAEGKIMGIMVLAVEVTEQVLAHKALKESEARFRNLIEIAPVATCVLISRNLTIQLANEKMLAFWGKNKSILGKPLKESLPELEGQPFLDILDQVYTTGIAYSSHDAVAYLEVDGVLKTYYFDFTYQPLFDANGKVYGIINMAIDVTEQVTARKKLQESEEALRRAVELAELGTWDIDLRTGEREYSPRLRSWLGLQENEPVSIEKVFKAINPHDHSRIQESLKLATMQYPGGLYEMQFTLVPDHTGTERIIHAQGRVFYDENGTPYRMSGTTRDITRQHQIQTALEEEVRLRTLELEMLNEELKATNEELNEANIHLRRSNEELEQYAYVASHDLQEPLRKIRMFTSRLQEDHSLNPEAQVILNRTAKAAERMTLLIKDLLEFSRLLKANRHLQQVNLEDVIRNVMEDFEMIIEEKKAVITIDPLPVLEGISLQFHQLFFNLFSNSLKFTQPHKAPQIHISSHAISNARAQVLISKPVPNAVYYEISFSDNGIGFDSRYADQIFEVFKRLHNRDQYPGSGIGLALCRRIVANHDGNLRAYSEPGKGTTFFIVLPSHQADHQRMLVD